MLFNVHCTLYTLGNMQAKLKSLCLPRNLVTDEVEISDLSFERVHLNSSLLVGSKAGNKITKAKWFTDVYSVVINGPTLLSPGAAFHFITTY